MLTLRPLNLLIALCCLAPGALLAQNAPVPDAPAPQKPAGLNLSLPAPRPGNSPAAEQAKTADVCGGAAEGVFALGLNGIPAGQTGAANTYMKSAFSRVLTNWNQRPKYDMSNHVGHAHVVRIRFVIYPNGSYSMPEATGKSGDARDDERALAAVRDVIAFPPLPYGFEKPIVACMRLGYNTDSDGMHTTADEPWLNKAVDGKKP